MSRLQHQTVRDPLIPTPHGDSIEPTIGIRLGSSALWISIRSEMRFRYVGRTTRDGERTGVGV